MTRYASATQFTGSYQALFHRLQRLSFLMGTLPHNERVVEVFPLLAISLKVELDKAVSLVTGQKANAFQGP